MFDCEIGHDELPDTESMPWAEASDGVLFKLLRPFSNDAGWVSLLRVRAGTGNVDSWSATGDHDMVGLFVVNGVVEYLSAAGNVATRETATTNKELWAAFLSEEVLAR
jgi:hypothetical protein